MKVFPRTTVVFVIIAAWFLVASPAMAAYLPNNVSHSRHNFGYSNEGANPVGMQYVGGIQEVCKYCHTPHNANQANPNLLWNKANDTSASYKMYTSSRTLRRATVNFTWDPNSPSLLCLGCHDGRTAVNVLHTGGTGADVGTINLPVGTSTYPAGAKYAPTPDASEPFAIRLQNISPIGDPEMGLLRGSMVNIGRATGSAADDTTGSNLADDHPVGFSYQSVYDERNEGLHPVSQVGINSGNRIRFFGSDNRLECSSCHNPHADDDDTSTIPFLAMSNEGSALCLSCHNK